jgi:hypothetical protein
MSYNPFNPFIQEYLCDRLSNLTKEQYRILSPSERNTIIKKGKIINFVKKKSIFSVLSVLTKIGVNWGIYIIDENFDLDAYKDIVDNKDFVSSNSDIKNVINSQKSFITNSKFFAQTQNLIHNSLHGLEAVFERRFIKISEIISKKIKDNFDSFTILHPEVEYKKASEGSLFILDLFRNLPKIKAILQNIGMTFDEFILLTEMYYNSEKYYTSHDIVSIVGAGFDKNIKNIVNNDYVFANNNQYNISTKGILIIGEIIGKYLENLYLP